MLKRTISLAGLSLVAFGMPATASAQGRPDPVALATAQREAMTQLAAMDGEWRGPAWTMLPSGEKHTVTQTERAGLFLDGAIRVVEGRGYEDDGSVAFNALGVISYDPAAEAYSIRTYAQGRSGDFVLTPTEDGFYWEIPAGPMTIRYTAVVTDDTWTEVGDRLTGDSEPFRFFEMTLTRVGDTAWPAGGAVKPK